MSIDISDTLSLLYFVNKMSEHRYGIRISESCIDPNPLMVERQDPDNFTRFQTRERFALEIVAYVFKAKLFLDITRLLLHDVSILRDFRNSPFYIHSLLNMVNLRMYSLSFFILLHYRPRLPFRLAHAVHSDAILTSGFFFQQ